MFNYVPCQLFNKWLSFSLNQMYFLLQPSLNNTKINKNSIIQLHIQKFNHYFKSVRYSMTWQYEIVTGSGWENREITSGRN